MAEFEQVALQFAIAPPRVCLSEAQQEFFDMLIRGWPTRFTSLDEGPFAAQEIAVPTQDGVRLKQEQHLLPRGFRVAIEGGKLAREHGESELLPARNAGWRGMLSWEEAQLLTAQQDFEVLVGWGACGKGDEVKQQRDNLSKKKVEHSRIDGTSCAGPPEAAGDRFRAARSATGRSFRTLQGSKRGKPGEKGGYADSNRRWGTFLVHTTGDDSLPLGHVCSFQPKYGLANE
jgi:hypothetical protein